MAFPVDARYITATEQRLGVVFPADFTRHMRQRNGGEVEAGSELWQLHPVRDESDPKRLSRTSNDIVSETETARGWRGFPAEAVAIGANGTGNRLVLTRSELNPNQLAPTVFAWDHETGRLRPVAGSFAELRFVDPRASAPRRPGAERLDRLDARGVVIDEIPPPWQLFKVGKVKVSPSLTLSTWPYFYSSANYEFRHGRKAEAKAVLTKPVEPELWGSTTWWAEQFRIVFQLPPNPTDLDGAPATISTTDGTLGDVDTVTVTCLNRAMVAARPPDADYDVVLFTGVHRLASDLNDFDTLLAALAS